MRNLIRFASFVAVIFAAGGLATAQGNTQSCFDLQHPGTCFASGQFPPSWYQLWWGASNFEGNFLAVTTSPEKWIEFVSPTGDYHGSGNDPAAEFFVCTPDVVAAALADFPNNLELCIINYFDPPFSPGTLAISGSGKFLGSGVVTEAGNGCPQSWGLKGEATSPTGSRFEVSMRWVDVETVEETCAAVVRKLDLSPIMTSP